MTSKDVAFIPKYGSRLIRESFVRKWVKVLEGNTLSLRTYSLIE